MMNTTQETTTKATRVHAFEKAGLGKAPFKAIGFYESKFQAVPGDPNCPIQPGSSCDYCGNGIMNVYQVRSADGKTFKVGCDCVAKTGDAALQMGTRAEFRAFKREQRNAAWKAEQTAKVEQAAKESASMLASNPALAAALKGDHPIIRDIANRLERFGAISEKQAALVLKIDADERARAAEVFVSAPSGKATITGQVVSSKLQPSDFGATWKMTVKVSSPAGSWLAYGTIPTSILEALRPELDGNLTDVIRGRTVSFTATFSRGNEAHFAFFARPTKATIDAPKVAA